MPHRITLRQMRYFVAAAEHCSIAIASEKIHVSSPTISAAISHIESELNVQLFIRQHAKGLMPTDMGERVRQKFLLILEETSELHSMVASLSGEVCGTLKLGCFSAFAPMIYADIVHGYSELYPQVKVEFSVGDQKMLLTNLMNNTLDIALLYDLNIDNNSIVFDTLSSLPPHALFSTAHPLAESSSVSLATLANYPMVLLEMPNSYEYFLSLFSDKQLIPNIVTTSQSVDLIRTMVANDIGYSILNVRPQSDYALDGKRLVRVPISGKQRPMRMGLATAKNSIINPATQTFINRCKSLISDDCIPGMSELPLKKETPNHA